MKALTLTEYKNFTYGEVPTPEVPPGYVRVRVGACGICGSDIHGMDGSSGRRIPPLIMGHEAAGTVDTCGVGVDGWARGDRVTFDSTIYCGSCDACQSGRVNLCPDRRVLGVSCGDYRQHGAFAEYVSVPAHVLYSIPEGLSFDEACFVEPVSVALHAVGRVPVQVGDTGVVVGAGIIGLLVIQALKVAGCSRVIAVDLDEKRLALAAELGADECLVSDVETVPARVAELTGGSGADIVMEVVGIAATLNLAFACVKKGGALGLVGNLAQTVDFPLQAVVTGEILVTGSCASAGEYPEALRHLAGGSIKVRPLISGVAELGEGADWFARLYDNKEGLVKVILKPSA